MRKLKYINRITSLAVTVILFAVSMFLFEACSSDNKDFGIKDNIRVVKMKSTASGKISAVFSLITCSVNTATGAITMTTCIVREILEINIEVFKGASEIISTYSAKSNDIELY